MLDMMNATHKGAGTMTITPVESTSHRGPKETRTISRLKVGCCSFSPEDDGSYRLRGPKRTACHRAIDSITEHRSRVDDPTRQVDLR